MQIDLFWCVRWFLLHVLVFFWLKKSLCSIYFVTPCTVFFPEHTPNPRWNFDPVREANLLKNLHLAFKIDKIYVGSTFSRQKCPFWCFWRQKLHISWFLWVYCLKFCTYYWYFKEISTIVICEKRENLRDDDDAGIFNGLRE